MALFGTTDASSSSNTSAQTKVSLVGEGTVFEGTIEAASNVRVSGRVIGRIDIDGKAVVAEGGAVEGEVRASDASVAGLVRGNVTVDNQLILRETARVDGNIRADRLIVEDGAVFVGECSMNGALPDLSNSSDGRAAQVEPMPEVKPSMETPSSNDEAASTSANADAPPTAETP